MKYPGRVGLQQRVLPTYRVPFFDCLAEACEGQLGVYAGAPRSHEAIRPAHALHVGHFHHGHNLHLFRTPFYLCWQTDLMSWLRNWDPDALIVEANPRYPISRSAIAWMHARNRPVLGWGLGAPALRGAIGLLRGWFRRRFIGRFDVLIAYSERGAEEYAALGFPPERIVVAANAVAPPPASKPERPPLAGRLPRLIFVGRLQARKRVDLLLKACAELKAKPKLTVVGDGPERVALEALAEKIYPQAYFSGALFGQDLQEALTQADLFVLPGTGGLAVQQAMASGLPVIVARGDGTQEDLVSGGNGWLIAPDNAGALVNALQMALEEPEQLEQMGTRSYNLTVERFNLHSMRDQFIRALALSKEVV
jgi:glycosyltransferase involved in cell wall biosynthesis